MSSGSRYVILCEDLQSSVFLSRALKRLGVGRHQIRVEALPSSNEGGAGEQYVRKHTPTQVKKHRTLTARFLTSLIIHLDADPANSVQDRRQQLDDGLRAQAQEPIGLDERIARLIPKRNIETWIHFYLDGPPVDEVQAYPRYSGNESACWPAAEMFADDAARNTPVPQAPPSLSEGLAEFRKVL
ncbi:hypothetical protein OV207_07615 [Corallococcus sp. BB11-1]|uniref:hypothetical protein n=1 Tax=Corallococcus sp. BB11-1 TaxID=2996783 RepID=UPI00226FC998|nr:hypothetical protein [Corallococcus sp. BB11-1]MCY1031318.1 hypothetical protein [Corallococcus sp. BB11-1]